MPGSDDAEEREHKRSEKVRWAQGGNREARGRVKQGGREEEDKKGKEKEESIPGLGVPPGGVNAVGVVLKLQPRIMRLLYEDRGKELISHFRAQATDTKGKRGLVLFLRARGKC